MVTWRSPPSRGFMGFCEERGFGSKGLPAEEEATQAGATRPPPPSNVFNSQ